MFMSELTLRREYYQVPTQWAGPAAALRLHLLPLVLPEPRFNGGTVNDGETLRFDNPDEMLAAGLDSPDVHMTWNDRDWTTTIQLRKCGHFDPGLVELSLSLDSARRDTARAAIAARATSA
jgi:hypothetical protein